MTRKENIRFVLTAGEALKQLEGFDDDGVLIDVDVKSGKGYFPKLNFLGKGNLLTFEREYINYVRNRNFDIPNVDVLFVDTTDSEVFNREFLPMIEDLTPQIPDYATSIGELRSVLNDLPSDTVILKLSDEDGKFMSPGFLGHYNNESYPLVDKSGKPITAGLNNNQTATFTFISKSNKIIGDLKFEFESK